LPTSRAVDSREGLAGAFDAPLGPKAQRDLLGVARRLVAPFDNPTVTPSVELARGRRGTGGIAGRFILKEVQAQIVASTQLCTPAIEHRPAKRLITKPELQPSQIDALGVATIPATGLVVVAHRVTDAHARGVVVARGDALERDPPKAAPVVPADSGGRAVPICRTVLVVGARRPAIPGRVSDVRRVIGANQARRTTSLCPHGHKASTTSAFFQKGNAFVRVGLRGPTPHPLGTIGVFPTVEGLLPTIFPGHAAVRVTAVFDLGHRPRTARRAGTTTDQVHPVRIASGVVVVADAVVVGVGTIRRLLRTTLDGDRMVRAMAHRRAVFPALSSVGGLTPSAVGHAHAGILTV
jgi:hypothetical protein